MRRIHGNHRRPRYGKYLCLICNEPVTLETANTDDHGRAVHEECYAQEIVADAKRITKSRGPEVPDSH